MWLKSLCVSAGFTRTHALGLIFFASGFAGLIYESIWTHYLKLFLGHAAYAQTLVLAIFMGGMAIGAALAARHTARLANPLRLYALVEAAIGLFALSFDAVFVSATEGFYSFVASQQLDASSFTAAKWGLATLLILPQSVLLGSTFPLFAAAATRALPAHKGRSIATLYFANSLGGAIGVLASGFILIPALGLPGTMGAAGVINLAIALLVAWMSSPAVHRPEPAQREQRGQLTPMVLLMLVVSFMTGASSFIYEVGWIRMLSLTLGSATHAFELMLSSFIFGLAIGGFWVRKRVDSVSNAGILLGYVQIAMGFAAIATIPLHTLTFDLTAYLVNTLPKSDQGYTLFNLARYGISSLIMFPAAFCAGMTLPLATRILYATPGQGERAIGMIYAANTLGAIAGITFAVHIGLPVLGLNYLVASGAITDVLLGGLLLAVFAGRSRLRLVAAATVMSVVGTAFAATTFDPKKLVSGVFRTGRTTIDGDVVAIKHGKSATISVERDAAKMVIRTNGKADASAYIDSPQAYVMDEVTMTLIGVLPLMLHPAPRRVANIGFGSGITAAAILDDPRVEHLDNIEIEPAMVELARHFGAQNQAVFSDPRSAIRIDDAKSFFAANGGRRYDLIVSEPSNPWVSGVAGLFSVEFYRHVRRYLADGGLFAQWLQVYETHPERAASVIKAIAQSFDDYLVIALDYGDILIVARKDGPVALAPDAFAQLSAATAQRLHRIDVGAQADLALRVLGNKALFGPWLARQPVPANSDFRPYLNNHADRDRFIGASWSDVFSLGFSGYPVADLLGVRAPLSAPACSSANSHFGEESPGSLARLVAQRLPGAVGSGAACGPGGRLSDAHIRLADTLIAECATPPMGDRAYAASRLAIRVLPFLSPQEGSELLALAAPLTCLANPDPSKPGWSELLHHLAQRNPDGIGRSAEALLSSGQGGTEVRTRYLLGMAMLGHLGAARHARAKAVWTTHATQALVGKPPGLVLEILRDHAFAGAAPG